MYKDMMACITSVVITFPEHLRRKQLPCIDNESI